MDTLSYAELAQTVQTCQLLLFRVQDDLARLQKNDNIDFKKKYETLLGERVHLLNEMGQLLLEREQAKRLPVLPPLPISPPVSLPDETWRHQQKVKRSCRDNDLGRSC